jgi:hypothetical protein
MGHVPFFLPPAPGQYSSHCSTLQQQQPISLCFSRPLKEFEGGEQKKRNGFGERAGQGGPEGVEDVAAGGEAVEVLVGERAEVLVADCADRPRGGGHVGVGGGIQSGAGSSSCGWFWAGGGKPSGFVFCYAGVFGNVRFRGGKFLYLFLSFICSRFLNLFLKRRFLNSSRGN